MRVVVAKIIFVHYYALYKEHMMFEVGNNNINAKGRQERDQME
jgi:hypothetical protein